MAVTAVVFGLALPAVAFGHLERPSYWPDPAPDTSVNPPAGGGFPEARSLKSAVTGKGPGEVRVVCQDNSFKKAKRAIRSARKRGFRIRPSQPKIRYSKRKARKMVKINKKLFKRCDFGAIQPAVNASGNNDRIVIMPGRYLEEESRAAPTNDPRCNPTLLQKDASGDDTPSYAYQVTCPHDQNLVYVQGRALKGEPLAEPRSSRTGIPEQELGECVRCNLQIEGSGPRPTDVLIDAGTDYTEKGINAKPGGYTKHVVMRVDRADGFVGRNMLMRGGLEFGFYVEETDGVLLDKTKFFWNADYGHLSFTTDHNLIKNCDGYGAGDAVIYPGAAPETGSQATDFYPDAPRANTVVKKCDMRGSELGYSGSMGNAVKIKNNHIYGNTTGIASDTLSSSGHPGFPADSVYIENNYIYSNNFNVYREDSPVEGLVTVPVGTGVIFAGMNDAVVRNNWFFDNWRFGVALFAVPDFLTSYGGPEGDIYPGVSCNTSPGLSTSCGNHFYNNRMGEIPPGFKFPKALDQFDVPHGSLGGDTLRNGVDFWWDEFVSNRANCWYDNYGFDGKKSTVTGPGTAGGNPVTAPDFLPDCAGGENEDLSLGQGDPSKEAYLIDCSEGPDDDQSPGACDWWFAPEKPGSAAAARKGRAQAKAAAAFNKTPRADRLRARALALSNGATE